MLGLTCYLDDSGSDDKSPVTVVGGVGFSRIQLRAFCERWRPLLKKHRIPEPLHLTDFSRPFGRHVGMHREMKLALFGDIAKLILRHYQFSISITVFQSDYEKLVHEDLRKHVASPIGMSFFCAVMACRTMAERHSLARIAYLADEGCSFQNQFVDAHAAVVKAETGNLPRLTGGLDFRKDDHVPALQIADVVAGSARRDDNGTLVDEFEPLRQLLEAQSHIRIRLTPESIARIAMPIYNWIVLRGSPPSLQDILKA